MDVEMEIEQLTENFDGICNISYDKNVDELDKLFKKTSIEPINFVKIKAINWNKLNQFRNWIYHSERSKFIYTYGTVVYVRKHIEEQYSYFKYYKNIMLSEPDKKILNHVENLIKKFLSDKNTIYCDDILELLQNAIYICLPLETFLHRFTTVYNIKYQ